MMVLLLCILFSTSELEKILQMEPKAAIAFVEKKGVTPYDFGMDLLAAGDIDGATRFFSHLSNGLDDDQRFHLLYGKAWLHWVRFEFEEALRVADYIIFNSGNDVLLARSHYLIGMIHEMWEEHSVALENIEKTLAIYKKMDQKAGIQRCYVRLHSLHQLTGNQDKADQFMELAEGLKNQKKTSEARILDAQAMMAFDKRDFAQTILICMKAIEAWQSKSEVSVAWHNSRIAFSYAMLGDYNKAYHYAELVDNSSVSEFQEPLKFFNSLTWMMLARCRNLSYKTLKNRYIDWSNSHSRKHYHQELLNLLESNPCPSGISK